MVMFLRMLKVGGGESSFEALLVQFDNTIDLLIAMTVTLN
jgi:hypothetical protein